MPAPEKLTIDTPEQVALEFPLAGVGSRFLALAFDTLLQAGALFVLLVIAIFVRWATGRRVPVPGTWVLAGLLVAAFVVYTGYFATFEALWRGQTPGKRRVGLRVIDASGRPATVYGIIIRNLVRIVDQVPGIYAVGILTMILSPRQQRLGDLAANTVVVHERSETIVPEGASATPATRYGAERLTPDEVLVVEGFLQRRRDIEPEARLATRRRIVSRLVTSLGVEQPEDEDRFLEQLAREYRAGERR